MNAFRETSASHAYFHIRFPSAKNKADKQKKLRAKQSKGALKAASEPGMRSDGYRKEQSQVCLPGRSPTDARAFPMEIRCTGVWGQTVPIAALSSRMVTGFMTRIIRWVFLPPSQTHPWRRGRMQAEYFHCRSRCRAVIWASTQRKRGCMFLRWLH